jgi:hypothetical protein
MTYDGLPHQVLEFFRSYGNVGTEPSHSCSGTRVTSLLPLIDV